MDGEQAVGLVDVEERGPEGRQPLVCAFQVELVRIGAAELVDPQAQPGREALGRVVAADVGRQRHDVRAGRPAE